MYTKSHMLHMGVVPSWSPNHYYSHHNLTPPPSMSSQRWDDML